MRTPFLALIKWVFLSALVFFSTTFFSNLFGIWWTLYPCAFLAGLLFRFSWLGIIFAALVSGSLVWMLPSLLWVQTKGLGFFIALDKSMGLPGEGLGFLLATGILGGLMSVLGMVSGQSFLRLVKPKTRNKTYAIPDYKR